MLILFLKDGRAPLPYPCPSVVKISRLCAFALEIRLTKFILPSREIRYFVLEDEQAPFD